MSDKDFQESELLKRHKARERFWALLACYMAGELSQMQAAKLMGISSTELNDCENEHIQIGQEMWKRYRATGQTINDDIRAEMNDPAQMQRFRLSHD